MKKTILCLVFVTTVRSDVSEIERNFPGYVYPQPPPVQQEEPLPPMYLPPIFSDELPLEPPPSNYLPPSNSYLPPNDNFDDTVVIPASPLPQPGYLPSNPHFRIENMSCTHGLNFKATFKMTNDLPQFPVVDEAQESCIASMGNNVFRINLDNLNSMLKCGVRRCKSGNNENMCVVVRVPTVRGVRLPEDPLVTLMCTPQERVMSQTKHVKLGSNKIQQASRARSNSAFIATGGSQKDLKTRIGIFRKRPGSNSFDENVLSDSVIQLGEELALRSVVNEGDGWRSSMVGPILITGLISKKSALLVNQQGCVNPVMKNICPKQPFRPNPLSIELHFRAFLFQESPQGDEMVVSVKTQGCLHPQDCFRPDSCPDDNLTRSKREIVPSNKNNDTDDIKNWESRVIFRVEPIRRKKKSSGELHNIKDYLNYIYVGFIGLVLSVFVVGIIVKNRHN